MRVVARVPEHPVDLRPRAVRVVARAPTITALVVGLLLLIVARAREHGALATPDDVCVCVTCAGEPCECRGDEPRFVAWTPLDSPAACDVRSSAIELLECERDRIERSVADPQSRYRPPIRVRGPSPLDVLRSSRVM